MISPDEAYRIGYEQVGSQADGWATSSITGDFAEPTDPPTTWAISWFSADGSVLASAQVDAQTGVIT
jgi:hypothetical protein